MWHFSISFTSETPEKISLAFISIVKILLFRCLKKMWYQYFTFFSSLKKVFLILLFLVQILLFFSPLKKVFFHFTFFSPNFTFLYQFYFLIPILLFYTNFTFFSPTHCRKVCRVSLNT